MLISESTRVTIACAAAGISCGSACATPVARVTIIWIPPVTSAGRLAVIAFSTFMTSCVPCSISPGSADVMPSHSFLISCGPSVVAFCSMLLMLSPKLLCRSPRPARNIPAALAIPNPFSSTPPNCPATLVIVPSALLVFPAI